MSEIDASGDYTLRSHDGRVLVRFHTTEESIYVLYGDSSLVVADIKEAAQLRDWLIEKLNEGNHG